MSGRKILKSLYCAPSIDMKSDEKNVLHNLQFVCDVCDEACDSKHSLNLHFVTTHGHQILQTFDCDICGLRFDSRNEIKNHFVQIHRLTLFECGFCSELYKSPELFKNHLKSHFLMRNTVFSNAWIPPLYDMCQCCQIFCKKKIILHY